MTDVRIGGAALARCVACSAEEFGDAHWGRAPRLSRAAELGADFSDLFSPEAVDELVSERGLRAPFLRMAKDGAVQAASSFTRGGGAGAAIADQAADDKVLANLAAGSTLVLQGLHRIWPPVVEFGARLADELGHPVQVNAYITPSQSQGFAPHHDTHDVFVLQVAGRKHWLVHDPVVANPLENQSFDRYRPEIAELTAQDPSIDAILEPGDALYLPRGTVHSARALGETSIHLTVGVHPLTRYTLVRALCDAVQDDPALRASLPVGVDLADADVLGPQLEATVAALRDALLEIPAARVADAIGDQLRQRTRPQPLRPLEQLELAGSLDGETPLRRREALRLRTVRDPDAATLRIVLLDRTITFPAETVAAVELALSGRGFAPSDLPGLEPSEQLTLARRLLREGIVVPE